MKLVLVTGMSGAGKGVALKTLEDAGFEAIDNIPLAYLSDIASSSARNRNLAVSADIRSRDFSYEHFTQVVNTLRANPDLNFKILFLDSDDDVLRKRYTETRRRHPLALDRTVMDGITIERGMMAPLRDLADIMIDTSETAAADLRRLVNNHFAHEERSLALQVISFSFKRGVPRDADMVFDARFLKNPHYDVALKHKTGMDEMVGTYVASDPDYAGFMEKIEALIISLLDRYKHEGKHYLTIAIGCTGGKHRSVYVAEQLAAHLGKTSYAVEIRHRDMSNA